MGKFMIFMIRTLGTHIFITDSNGYQIIDFIVRSLDTHQNAKICQLKYMLMKFTYLCLNLDMN